MKDMPKSLLLSLLAGTLLTKSNALAQVWETVDTFQLVPGASAIAADIGTGADGVTLFSVGSSATSIGGPLAGVVRKSIDSGANWATVDIFDASKYADLGAEWVQSTYLGFGAGLNGSLFASGELWNGIPSTSKKLWIVRESVDGGVTWATVDAFSQGPTATPSCGDVKVNPYTGDVYAVGKSNAGQNDGFLWAVRKRAANSATFATVDMVGAPPSNAARAVGFHPSAGVFVVGNMGNLWTVLRSANGGASWTTVDSFQDSAKTYSEAIGIAVEPVSGAIYVSGQAGQVVKGKTLNNWVVRRSLDAGTTWTTVDRYGAEPAPYGVGVCRATGITLAPSGKVFVTGNSADPKRLIVRKGTTGSNGAMSWATSLDFQYVPGVESTGLGITSDAAGNIFVDGQGKVDITTGLGFFLTMKLAGPPVMPDYFVERRAEGAA